MRRMNRSKSRTSLLADLIATDDDSERATNASSSTRDLTAMIPTACLKEASPKTMLRELLSDLFIDADDLEKKELLGEGGFAVVHRCLYYDPVTQETTSVAMKELKPDLIESVEDLREFVMEASLQKKLRHNHIVRIIGIGATDCSTMQTVRRSMFILQEYVPGKNLKEMVIQQMCHRNEYVYSMKRAVGWLLDIAHVLHYLHDVCRPMIVHRDLKLDNILLSQNGISAKLCDFGLHKRIRTHGISTTNLNDGLDESYYGGMLYQSLMDRVAENEPSQGRAPNRALNRGCVGVESGEHSLRNGVPTLRDLTLSTQLNLSSSQLRSTQSLKPVSCPQSREVVEVSYSERDSREQKVGFTGKVGSIVYMAPEVYQNKMYNEKVDVFSFAIIMYELLAQTNLAVKYGLMGEKGSLSSYAERVSKGFRETIPSHWPEYVKLLVSECWDAEPANRPSFKDIIHRLSFIYDSGMEEKMRRPLLKRNFIPLKCCCIQ